MRMQLSTGSAILKPGPLLLAVFLACVDAAPELPLEPVRPLAAAAGIPTVVVNSLLDDVVPGEPGAPLCSLAKCTFRMALAEAQDGGKITFSENLCAAALSCEIFTGGLEIGRLTTNPVPFTVVINGPSAFSLTIRGPLPNTTVSPVLNVLPLATATIRNLTITGGSNYGSGALGGGIDNSGNLVLENVVVTGNYSDRSAGGIQNSGILELRNSSVTNNVSSSAGAITNDRGEVTLINTTVSGNVANPPGTGGGYYGSVGTLLTLLKKSCISGNTPANIVNDGTTIGSNCP